MKLFRRLFFVCLILIVLLAALVAMMPAKVAVGWMADRLGPVSLEQVSGSIWNGRAERFSAHGRPIGALGWKLHPLALLSGRVEVDLDVAGEEVEGTTFASIDRSRVLVLRNARLLLAAQRLQPALDIPALTLLGKVELQLDEAEFQHMFPKQLAGKAWWRDAAVSGSAEAVLGTLRSDFRTGADGALLGTIEDEGGPLSIEGQFRAALTGYEAEAVLSARDGNPQVLEALQYVGERQADGSSVLQIRGSLLGGR